MLIAVAMIALLAFVALAVDGGSMYAERRLAQNAADATAMAATRAMLDKYDIMIRNNDVDVPGSADDEAYINNALTTFATAHGLTRSDLQAYYVSDDKVVVVPQEVGSYNGVPWDLGAKGITVKAKAQTNSFFMSLFGWNTVSASANTTAFMGTSTATNLPVAILPIGLFTDTLNLPNFVIGHEYTLINDDTELGAGNRGWLDFNGRGSASVDRTWLQCGFNPTVSASEFGLWCPEDNNGRAAGPTQHYQCADHPDCTTPGAEIDVPYVKYGVGDEGWWINGQPGTTTSNCADFRQYVGTGREYMVPIFDYSTCCGQNTQYHMIGLALFRFTSIDIDCHVNNPGPGGGSHQHWVVSGTYERMVNPSEGGHHGDIRHFGIAGVFLDN